MTTIPTYLRDIPFGSMITTSGKIINLFDPDPASIDIEDIASSLSKLCRWGGNLSDYYSVAQHSCLVAWLAPTPLRLSALMHDAPEAYAGDVIRPIKSLLAKAYFDIEDRLKDAVCTRFNLHVDLLEAVKEYDDEALSIEFNAFHHRKQIARDQIKQASSTWLDVLPAEKFWHHDSAYIAFLNTYHSLVTPNREKIRRSPDPIAG
jgi:hypothetical protein